MNLNFADQFRQESLTQLKSLKPGQVKLFHSEHIGEFYTLVARLDGDSVKVIHNLQMHLMQIDSEQFYYPSPNLHLTILGNLPLELDPNILVDQIDSVIGQYFFQFSLKGIGSNEYCASVSAYPDKFSLSAVREELRTHLGVGGDDYSSILQSYSHMGWVNFLRYFRIPKQSLLDEMYAYRDTNFGKLCVTKIQLYKTTSKILEPTESKLVREWSL